MRMSHSTTPAQTNPAIRKAAILVATLDQSTANQLLDKMPPAQALHVRNAVAELRDFEPDERDAVIREFMHTNGPPPAEAEGGVELDAELAQKIRSPQGYDHLRSEANLHTSPQPFHAVSEANVEALVRQLERQHPQAIALVVAHFPPSRAAAVVERFSPALQANVLRRIAELTPTDPEVVREVEQELERLLSGEIRAARDRSAGLHTVAAIVNAAGSGKGVILGNLERHHQDLFSQLDKASTSPALPDRVSADEGALSNSLGRAAGRNLTISDPSEPFLRIGHTGVSATLAKQALAPLPGSGDIARNREGHADDEGNREVSFQVLSLLDDADWATLIRAVDSRVALLSLAGASEELVNRIAAQLPRREARDWRRRLEQVGPVQLADIRLAQSHLARRAEELAAEGKIRFPQRKYSAAA
jgi:flagellar motor switch protein FliG